MRWISVKDRPPEEGELVLCARTQTSMSGTLRIKSSVGTAFDKGRSFTCAFDWVSVTHWMQLPEPGVHREVFIELATEIYKKLDVSCTPDFKTQYTDGELVLSYRTKKGVQMLYIDDDGEIVVHFSGYKYSDGWRKESLKEHNFEKIVDWFLSERTL